MFVLTKPSSVNPSFICAVSEVMYSQACLCLQVVEQLAEFEQKALRQPLTQRQFPRGSELQDPVIVWWSPLTGELGRLGECGPNRCFFTVNKSYHSHPHTKAFLFYGESNSCILFSHLY